MAKWKVAYSKDNNTEVLEAESATKPSMEQAVQWLLDMAREKYDPELPKEDPQEEQTPAVKLAERYNIVITGISQ
jgi:hypothetical protein